MRFISHTFSFAQLSGKAGIDSNPPLILYKTTGIFNSFTSLQSIYLYDSNDRCKYGFLPEKFRFYRLPATRIQVAAPISLIALAWNRRCQCLITGEIIGILKGRHWS